MPAPAFTLSVPADEPFRSLAAESVRVYLRASGAAPEADAAAFAATVTEAAGRVAAAGGDIAVVVVSDGGRVDVQLTCGGASETVTFTTSTSGG